MHALPTAGTNQKPKPQANTKTRGRPRFFALDGSFHSPMASTFVIHTDFEKGFIKAEVVSFKDLDASGSMADSKAAGKVRMEGKDYVMQDGDVV